MKMHQNGLVLTRLRLDFKHLAPNRSNCAGKCRQVKKETGRHCKPVGTSTIRQIPAQGAVANQPGLSPAETDPWIFRDGRRAHSGHDGVRQICDCINSRSPGSLIDALIQAGELEAALSDTDSQAARFAAELTNSLAAAVCSGNETHLFEASELASRIHPPEWIYISPPEGFTYYALHPLDFSRVVQSFFPLHDRYAVVGIRSIGTTLSAVVIAELKLQGRPADRITVRPHGHPYNRNTQFTEQQTKWIDQKVSGSAQFLIVDEGPGRSGSTFLSVAEALLRAGVQRQQITMIGSRQPDIASLCADDAANRWSQFRFVSTSPAVNARFENHLYAGGGSWREILFPDQTCWPETWPQMERLKFISPDRRSLFKFEGMGRIGSDCRQRAFALAEAGFAPLASTAGDGFVEYELLSGFRPRIVDVTSSVLESMAQYCAFRASHFKVRPAGHSEIGLMVEFNLRQEFGTELQFGKDEFATAEPVIVDGKMQPHEWILSADNRIIKTDGIDHGDNHFFPGPCDIAWDLAGIAIEWELGPEALDRLVEKFCAFSGEKDIADRIPTYVLAYSTFQLAFCKMAAGAVSDVAEKYRLNTAYFRYRGVVQELLGRFSPRSALKVYEGGCLPARSHSPSKNTGSADL